VYRYRQLLPSAASLHSNRTVVVAVCYDHTYWAVINCSWNTFLLEDIGYDVTQFRSAYYKADTTVEDIRQLLLQHIGSALTDPSGGDVFRQVDVIKVVVKQLKGFCHFTSKEAGALTQSTVTAVRRICDDAAGPNSTLSQYKDKSQGSVYIRSQQSTGHKFQVLLQWCFSS